MEEALLDHGMDRLRFSAGRLALQVLFIFLGPTLVAQATSFGPSRLVDHVRESTYFVRGVIQGSSWTALEPHYQRPYTYWRLRITEQPGGSSLGSEIDIRQPGGEVGELGYRVAGTANFQPGEDVFVSLRDTHEPRAKEIVGLASGKYTVKDSQVRNGLGGIIAGENGRPLKPEEFSQIVARISRGQARESDEKIFVNRNIQHDPEDAAGAPERERKLRAMLAGNKPKPAAPATASSPPRPDGKEVKVDSPEPEKVPEGNSSGTWWILGGVILVLAAGAFLILRR